MDSMPDWLDMKKMLGWEKLRIALHLPTVSEDLITQEYRLLPILFPMLPGATDEP